MLAHIPASPELRPYVDSYLYVQDIAGVHRGKPIRTAPRPGGVLTVNLGRPNQSADGGTSPALSLLGVQTRARNWRSDADTHFIAALLTPAGLARLAPAAGPDTVDTFLDLGLLIGGREACALLDFVSARRDALAASLDDWLTMRLIHRGGPPETMLLNAACTVLAQSQRVDVAADKVGISRRHLSRVVSRNLGIAPKVLVSLYRLDRSLRALQSGKADGVDGFADQAHQTREWRRRLGTTPGRYAREGRSALAKAWDPVGHRSVFYL
jgi:AraC-like DNA-binding protein